MIYFKIEDIKIGMILGKDIQDSKTNMTLLRKGTILSNNHILSLKKHGFNGVYIEKELFNDVVIEDIISEEIKNNTIKSLKEFNIESIIENAKEIVSEIISKSEISFDMIDTSDKDDYFYVHALKVAEMSIIIGKKLNLTEKNLNELAVAALLHDYGKLCKNKTMMDRIRIYPEYGNFDSYEKEKYPLYSFLLINRFKQINTTTKNIILSHNINQSDEAFSVIKNNSVIHAKHNILGDIIHVADLYDVALKNTSFDNYNNIKIIEDLKQNCNDIINNEYLNILLEHIPLHPIGTMVKLSDGREAVVIKNNKELPTKPIVKTFNGKIINLMEINYLTIIDQNEKNKTR